MSVCYQKKATRITVDGFTVFDMEHSSPNDLNETVLDELDILANHRDVVQRIIRLIHSIPTLFDESENIQLDHIYAYVGRSKLNLAGNRLLTHWEKSDRPYAIPVCISPGEDVASLEKFSIHYLSYLRKINALCISQLDNVHKSGGVTSHDSVIYLSFGIDKRMKSGGYLEKKHVPLAVGKIHGDLEDSGENIKAKHIEEILLLGLKPAQKCKLHWHQASKK